MHASLCFLSVRHAQFIGRSRVAPYCKIGLVKQGRVIIVCPSPLDVACKIIKKQFENVKTGICWPICRRPFMSAFLSSMSSSVVLPSAALPSTASPSAAGSSMLSSLELPMERESNPTMNSSSAVPSWKRPRRASGAF